MGNQVAGRERSAGPVGRARRTIPRVEACEPRVLLSGAVSPAPAGGLNLARQASVTVGSYEGTKFTNLAVYRPATGEWLVKLSTGGTFVRQFGDPAQGDVAV